MKYNWIFSIGVFSILSLLSCTKDTGNVIVHYQEATAIYGDMDLIRSQKLEGNIQDIVNPGKIHIGDNFIFIGEEGIGVHVINNEDKNNPVFQSFINIPGNREFYVDEDFLYAESYYDMLKIDISNPYKAILNSRAEHAIQDEFVDEAGNVLVGFSYEDKSISLDENDDFYKEIIGDQLVYLDFAANIIPNSAIPSSFASNSSGQNGTVNRIAKAKDVVYVVSKNNIIVLNDSGDQFSSAFLRLENIKEDMETVFPYHDNLFIGSRSSMSILDISNPMAPREVYDFDHATSCDPVLPHNQVAYITLRTADFSDCPGNINALIAIDIHDLNNPTQEKELQMTSPYGMTIIGNQLFVGEGMNGLSVFDISNNLNPLLIKSFPDVLAYDIIADPSNGNILLIAGPNGLDQYIINENLSLEFKSKVADY